MCQQTKLIRFTVEVLPVKGRNAPNLMSIWLVISFSPIWIAAPLLLLPVVAKRTENFNGGINEEINEEIKNITYEKEDISGD